MKKSFILTLALFGALSCDNEIDLYSGGDPLPVVYCLLNPEADVQYVRLARSYISDATLAGKPPHRDSTLILTDAVIYVEKYNEMDDPEELYYFTEIQSPAKDSGWFQDSSFTLFEAHFRPEHQAVYSLYVYLPDRKGICSGRTQVMTDPQIIDPMNVPNRAITFDSLSSLYIRWMPALHGGLYQGIFRLHYAEILDGHQENKFVDFPTPIFAEMQSADLVEKRLNPENYFQYLSEHLHPDPDIRRRAISMEYLYYATGKDLALWYNTLQDETSTQNSIFEYTNMTGAKGIFSSWMTRRIPNIPLSPVTRHNLAHHPLTSQLGFEE